MEFAAGIAIYKPDSLLLVHPFRASWKRSYSIPKGRLEEGELPLAAAIRELKEETGISIRESDVPDPDKKILIQYAEHGRIYKELVVFFLPYNQYSPIEIPSVIPKHQLQLSEVDWAGFVNFKEIEERMLPRLLPILKQL